MIECPHCHTKVLPQLDGTCPSCLKNTREKPADSTVKVRLRGGCEMPKCCHQCGDFTSRTTNVQFTEPGADGDGFAPSPFAALAFLNAFAFVFLIFVSFFRAIGYLLQRESSIRTSTVRIRLPQCRDCGKKRKPYPHRIWFAEKEMDFVVNPDFAAEFARVNPRFDLMSGRWC